MAPLRRAGDTPALTIDFGSGYEMLMSMLTIAETSNHDVVEIGREWIDETSQRAGKALIARLHEFSQGNGDAFGQLLPRVYDAPARDADTFLAHLATIDADEIARQMLGFYDYHTRRVMPPEQMRAAVAGDEQAIADVLAAADTWPEWRPFAERVLTIGPERTKRELLQLLRDWRTRVWQAEESRLLPILERDAEAKRELARDVPFERFIEVATNGVQFVARPDIDHVVLIPSYINRPWVTSEEWCGAMMLVYPVADETISAETDAPPARLLRLTKALADEKRLRILRTLAEKPRSLVELAELFEVPKTTMHHHMLQLRSAGLVAVTAGTKDYRLRSDVLPGLAQMLAGYVASAAPRTDEPAQPSGPAARRQIGARREREREAARPRR